MMLIGMKIVLNYNDQSKDLIINMITCLLLNVRLVIILF
jgi:hypothetical protein